MGILNRVCSLCVVHGVFVAAQHEVEVDDESQLMEVQLLQLSSKVGKKVLPASEPPCAIGDHVVCPDGSGANCAGNQCCPDGSACPSASEDFNSCQAPRAWSCSGGSPPSPPPAATTTSVAPPPAPPSDATPAPSAATPAPAGTGGGVPASRCGDDTGCIVRELNAAYFGFNHQDRNSPSGVTIRMATWDDFKLHCGNGCFNGYSDCKMSASLYNHRVMRGRDGRLHVAMKRNSGIVFHQAAVETTLSKCSFQYDGATYYRVNRGCGCSANGDCNNPDGAFRHTGTAGHDLVDRCSCDSLEQRRGSLPGWQQELCFWRGPAYDATGATTDNQLFDMLTQRISTQDSQGQSAESMENWNEVVLDAAVMQQTLASDPRGVIQAFFYVRGKGGRGHADSMADKFEAEYGARIPVIELNPDGANSGAPFVNP